MKAVTLERFQGCWSGPEVIVDTCRNRLSRCVSDRVAPLEAQPACQVDFADHSPIVKSLDCFLESGRGADLRAVLNDTVVLLSGTHQLAAFPEIMRADRKSTRLNSSHGYISYAV